MWAAAILVVSIVEDKEFALLMLVILAAVSLGNLGKVKWIYYSLFQNTPLLWSNSEQLIKKRKFWKIF